MVLAHQSPRLFFYHPACKGERRDGKESNLEKLTVKELKEVALAMGGIAGVTAMKKDELIAAIKQAKGMPVRETREKPVDTVLEAKRRIRELRARCEELREAGGGRETALLRRKMSKLKKKTRRLARKAASQEAS